jgi:HSP20 family protein
MGLIRYTPYSYPALQEQANQLFDQLAAEAGSRSEGLGGGMFTPPVDVREDANAYIIELEAPGMKQEQLSLTLQENTLTIRGEKAQSQDEGEGQYRRVERSYGAFARTLALPRNVDAAGVTAHLQDGVLEVRLPKQEDAKPRQILISTGSTVDAPSVTSASTAPPAATPGEEQNSDAARQDTRKVGIHDGTGAKRTSSAPAKSAKSGSAKKSGS